MSRPLFSVLDDAWFRLVFGLDFLLVSATLFALLYSLYMVCQVVVSRVRVLRVARPSRFRFGLAARSVALPVLLAVSLLLSSTPAGQAVADAWCGGWDSLLPAGLRDGVAPALALSWLAGMVWALGRLGRDWYRLDRLVRRGRVVTDDPAFARACRVVAAGRSTRLRMVDGCAGAASWGVWHRSVVVSAEFLAAFSEQDRYCIYVHELIHLAGRDTLKHLGGQFLRAVFWFNPLLAVAVRDAGDCVEQACDRRTLRRPGICPADYARLVVRAHAGQPLFPSGFSSDFERTRNRLGHITGDRALMVVAGRRLMPGVLCLAALSVAGLLFHGKAIRQPPPPASETLRVAPDGTTVRVIVTTLRDGALASYCIGTTEVIPEGASRPAK